MKCIICNSDSEYYFSKSYSESLFSELMRDVGEINYYKCAACGFVLSKTHSELDQDKWNDINREFHRLIENPDVETEGNQPPYAEQAMMLSLLGKNEIISTGNMLDYAAGYGTLSNILARYFGLVLPIFDPFVQAGDSDRYIHESELKSYQTVINSAMFEHIIKREDLDRLNSLVSNDGCLIIHTVICENVPRDPNWFYLYPPVHTAFHTNKSMEILMKQWGYQSSVYCPQSKCWVLLRNTVEAVEKKITALNRELQSEWFYCKNGFVDYWKGF